MRASGFHAFGGPEVLSVEEVPTPKASRGEVLVRVEAAWVNPVDYKIRNGGFVPADQLPMAAGREVAGVVAQCGAGTTGFSIGDRVYAMLPIGRSEEHPSEPQSLMRISYAVFCLTKQTSSLQTTLKHIGMR